MNKKAIVRNTSLAALLLYQLYKVAVRLPSSRNGKSLLWEVSGRDLPCPSYLFGTMHLMCAEDAALSNNVLKVLKLAQQVYLEVAMSSTGELMGGIADFAIRNNETLADLVSSEDYTMIRNFFESHIPGLSFSLLERQSPLMLSGSLYELFLPCESKVGTELLIAEQASKLNKTIGGLETLDFQKAVFHSMSYKQQATDLVNTIKNIDQFKRSMQQMLQVYKEQDIEKLHELTMLDEMGVASHLDLLLYNRNKDWVAKIMEVAQAGSALIAVGAGHLGGDKGLVKLLQAEGFNLRPIKNT